MSLAGLRHDLFMRQLLRSDQSNPKAEHAWSGTIGWLCTRTPAIQYARGFGHLCHGKKNFPQRLNSTAMIRETAVGVAYEGMKA